MLADTDLTPCWRLHGSPAVAGRLSCPGRRASGMKQVSSSLQRSHCAPEVARHPACSLPAELASCDACRMSLHWAIGAL